MGGGNLKLIKMYKAPKFEETSIVKEDTLYEGETIEMKVERIMQAGDSIEDGAPIVYQERQEGVAPSYDIRTDRFDYAIDAMDNVTASKKASREERIKELNESRKPKEAKKDTEGEPIQTTSQTQAKGSENQ